MTSPKKKSPAPRAGGDRASIGHSKRHDCQHGNATAQRRQVALLAAEARSWAAGKLLQGPAGINRFVIEPDGPHLWRVRVIPKRSPVQIHEGLTFPEAYRFRLELSSAGYLGKVVGR